jgi:hypothetical protein
MPEITPRALSSALIKFNELLISWLGSDAIYKSVMRIIEQQKESNNKHALSNVPPLLTTPPASTVATAVDGDISNLPNNNNVVTDAVDDLRGPMSPRGGGVVVMEEATMAGVEDYLP